MLLVKKMPKVLAVAVIIITKITAKGKTQDDIEIEKSNVIMVGETEHKNTFEINC